jgi:enamine deaminase RidA (YjgF/YER057c/UK114 family)
MSRKLITTSSTFESQIGYSRAVISGDLIFVSGTTGYNYTTNQISSDVMEQTEQALKNIEEALNEAGSGIKDVVRVRYVFVKREDFRKCWPVLRKWFGEVRPAATMIVAGLLEETMRVEIEVTAKKGSGE